MKTQIVLLAVIVGILLGGSAYAASDDRTGNPGRDRFERLDADGNGRVDSGEFTAGRELMFGRMDADGDGAITLEELEDAARREHVARRFERMDADSDGKVTRAEYTEAGVRIFAHLDDNGDGYLSWGEIERRRHGGAKAGDGRD